MQTYWLWEACVPTWRLWIDLQTQWRVGMGGATGLDYAAVWALLDRRLPRRRRADAFEQIQAMERTALTVWAERDEERRQNQDTAPRR